jgi:hypothetical protein
MPLFVSVYRLVTADRGFCSLYPCIYKHRCRRKGLTNIYSTPGCTSKRHIDEDVGLLLSTYRIKALTESFDSQLDNAGNLLLRQLGQHLCPQGERDVTSLLDRRRRKRSRAVEAAQVATDSTQQLVSEKHPTDFPVCFLNFLSFKANFSVPLLRTLFVSDN